MERKGRRGVKFIVILARCSRLYTALFRRCNFALKYQVCLGGGEESLHNIFCYHANLCMSKRTRRTSFSYLVVTTCIVIINQGVFPRSSVFDSHLFFFSQSALLSLFSRFCSIVSRFIMGDESDKSYRVRITFLVKTHIRRKKKLTSDGANTETTLFNPVLIRKGVKFPPSNCCRLVPSGSIV